VKFIVDLSFIGLEAELRSFKKYKTLVTENLPIWIEFERTRAWDEMVSSLGDAAPHDDELEIEFAPARHDIEQHLPRNFRVGLVITLCSVMEAGLGEITSYVGRPSNKTLDDLPKVKREGFVDRVFRFMRQELNLSPAIGQLTEDRMRLLYRVRNKLAHGNGRAQTADDMNKFVEWESMKIGLSVHHEFLNVSQDFIDETHRVVDEGLAALIAQAKRHRKE